MPPTPLGTKKFAEVLSVQKCESHPCFLDFYWDQHMMTHSIGTHEIRGKALCPLLLAGTGTWAAQPWQSTQQEEAAPGGAEKQQSRRQQLRSLGDHIAWHTSTWGACTHTCLFILQPGSLPVRSVQPALSPPAVLGCSKFNAKYFCSVSFHKVFK